MCLLLFYYFDYRVVFGIQQNGISIKLCRFAFLSSISRYSSINTVVG